MGKTVTKRKKSFEHRVRKFLAELGLFFILLIIPAFTIWVTLSNIQKNELSESQETALNEMAEITAHILRLSEPESYYQEAIRNMVDSFKWYDKIEDVPRISSKAHLDLSLFNSEGKMLNWPAGETKTKRTTAEKYLSCLRLLAKNPEHQLEKIAKDQATGYSGNLMTLKTLVDSPNTLINFQGIGLAKMGGWYKVPFKTSEGQKSKSAEKNDYHLLAWLNLDKQEKYSLTDKAVKTMERLIGSEYTFSYIDLNNPQVNKTTNGRKLKSNILKFLISPTIKSGFLYDNHLFSINDTKEGIRLICTKPSPKPLPILKNYIRILLVIIPSLILFFFWKKAFKVSFNLSVKYQAMLIFGFATVVGISAMIISTVAYQKEKKAGLAQDYKNKAIEILEKVDQQYTDSFSDLIVQYKQFITAFKEGKKTPSEILNPLRKAYTDGTISYAVYINKEGKKLFQIPDKESKLKSANIADKYSRIVSRVATECLKNFNSTRNTIETALGANTITAVTTNAIEGLLSNRSSFIETIMDSDEVVAFMDMPLDSTDLAKGCLVIVHEPKNLEMRYLNETSRNLTSKTDFELIAFPKKVSDQKSYFPRFSYTYEEPLWKLNDMLNQTQLPNFKEGYIQEEKNLVAAIPGNNLKNYNLFLAMPITKLNTAQFSLSNIFMFGLTISLVLIVVLSMLLINSITQPVKILTENALSIQEDTAKQRNDITFSDNTELESISTGLANLVVKVREFEEERNSCEKLFTAIPHTNPQYLISNFLSKQIPDNKSICYISKLEEEENMVFLFLARIDDASYLKASLPLAMYTMAMQLYTSQLSIRTPIACLQNLEEYFRINLRRHLTGSALVAFIDTKNNIITYSGFGTIRLLKQSKENKKCEIAKLPQGDDFIKEVKKAGNITCQLEEGDSFIAVTEPFSEIKLEALRQRIETNEWFNTDFEESLIQSVKELTKIESNGCNVAFVKRKELSKSPKINQILAKKNPTALIKSQKARSQTNV